MHVYTCLRLVQVPYWRTPRCQRSQRARLKTHWKFGFASLERGMGEGRRESWRRRWRRKQPAAVADGATSLTLVEITVMCTLSINNFFTIIFRPSSVPTAWACTITTPTFSPKSPMFGQKPLQNFKPVFSKFVLSNYMKLANIVGIIWGVVTSHFRSGEG